MEWAYPRLMAVVLAIVVLEILTGFLGLTDLEMFPILFPVSLFSGIAFGIATRTVASRNANSRVR